MTLDELKDQTKQQLSEFVRQYTYDVLPLEDQLDIAIGIKTKQQLAQQISTLQAYRALYQQKVVLIDATQTIQELQALNWQEGFESVVNGSRLQQSLKTRMLKFVGLTQAEFTQKTGV